MNGENSEWLQCEIPSFCGAEEQEALVTRTPFIELPKS